ncbi:MAG: hypothetical protein AABY74_07520, partial [Planctomycetota bacterium]
INFPENIRRMFKEYFGIPGAISNYDKSKYLYRTNVAILISLIILFFSLIPFYKVCHSGVKIQKSEIVEKE